MDIVSGKVIRDRNWFITINPDAESYIKFKEILSNMSNVIHYAYIYHKADEENVNDNHIHLCIEFKNARSFQAIQQYFIGSHIEHMKFKAQCYKYLIHKGYDDKIQYAIDDVITNDKDYYNTIIDTNDFERLDTVSILEDINVNGFENITAFVKKYGIHQVKNFVHLIKSLLTEHDYLTQLNICNDEIIRLNNEINKKDIIINDLKSKINKLIDDKLPF